MTFEGTPDDHIQRICGMRKRGQPEDIAGLMEYVSHEDEMVSGMATIMLGETAAPQALPLLSSLCLYGASGSKRRAGATALANYDLADRLPVLLKALDDPHPGVVARVIVSIGTPQSPEIWDRIEPLLYRSDGGIKEMVFLTLMKARRMDEKAIAEMERFAQSDEGLKNDSMILSSRTQMLALCGYIPDHSGQTLAEMVEEARTLLPDG